MEEKHNAELALKRERELKVGRGRDGRVGRDGGAGKVGSGYRRGAGIARWLMKGMPSAGGGGSGVWQAQCITHCWLPTKDVPNPHMLVTGVHEPLQGL